MNFFLGKSADLTVKYSFLIRQPVKNAKVWQHSVIVHIRLHMCPSKKVLMVMIKHSCLDFYCIDYFTNQYWTQAPKLPIFSQTERTWKCLPAQFLKENDM